MWNVYINRIPQRVWRDVRRFLWQSFNGEA